MLIAVKKKNIVSFIIIFGTLSFPVTDHNARCLMQANLNVGHFPLYLTLILT